MCPIHVGKEKLVTLSFYGNENGPAFPSSHSQPIFSHLHFHFLSIYPASSELDSFILEPMNRSHVDIWVSAPVVLADNYRERFHVSACHGRSEQTGTLGEREIK